MRPRSIWRSALAGVLITLGILLAPLSVVLSFAKAQIESPDLFVTELAPLAKDPNVQAFIVTDVMAAIDSSLDLQKDSEQVLDDLSSSLGLPASAQAQLKSFAAPVAAGVRSFVESELTKLVASDAFAQIWEDTLRASHQAVLDVLSGKSSPLVKVDADTVSLNIGPIVDDLKAPLVAKGLTVLNALPPIDGAVPLIRSTDLSTAQLAYSIVSLVGTWLPILVAALLAAGIALARRWAVAAVVAGAALTAILTLLSVGITVGQTAFTLAVSPQLMPAVTAQVIYDHLVAFISDLATGAAVLTGTLTVLVWLLGPFRLSRALRARVSGGIGALRASADRAGFDSGRLGRWLLRYRRSVWIGLAVIGLLIVGTSIPFVPTAIILTAVGGLLALALIQFLVTPSSVLPATGPAESSARLPATSAGITAL